MRVGKKKVGQGEGEVRKRSLMPGAVDVKEKRRPEDDIQNATEGMVGGF